MNVSASIPLEPIADGETPLRQGSLSTFERDRIVEDLTTISKTLSIVLNVKAAALTVLFGIVFWWTWRGKGTDGEGEAQLGAFVFTIFVLLSLSYPLKSVTDRANTIREKLLSLSCSEV